VQERERKKERDKERAKKRDRHRENERQRKHKREKERQTRTCKFLYSLPTTLTRIQILTAYHHLDLGNIDDIKRLASEFGHFVEVRSK